MINDELTQLRREHDKIKEECHDLTLRNQWLQRQLWDMAKTNSEQANFLVDRMQSQKRDADRVKE